MAYNFVRASDTYLRNDSVGTAAKPVTIAAWFRRTAVTGIQAGVYMGDPGQVTTRIALGRTSGTLRAMDRGATAAVNADGSNNGLPAAGTWYHAACTFVSATSRTPYLDGAAGSTSTTNCGTQVSYTRTSIGRMDQNSPQDAFDGDIAEVAIWDVALSGTDIAALAAGDSPMSLATAPVRYWRLKDDGDLTCLVSGEVLTVSGATWTSAHPTVDDPPSGGTEHFGASASAITVTPAVQGVRTTLGASATDLTVSPAATGTATRLGVAASAVTVAFASSGVRTRPGASATAITVSPAAAGTRETFGVAARPVTVTFFTKPGGGVFGVSGLALTVTAASAGRRETFGQTTTPITVIPSAVAFAVRFGASATPVVVGFETVSFTGQTGESATEITVTPAASGSRTTYGSVSLGIAVAPSAAAVLGSFGIAAVDLVVAPASSAVVGRFGGSALPISVDFSTIGGSLIVTAPFDPTSPAGQSGSTGPSGQAGASARIPVLAHAGPGG